MATSKEKAADAAATEETAETAPETTETPAEAETPVITPEAPTETPEAAPSVPEGVENPAEEARKRRDARQAARQDRLDNETAPREESRVTSLDTFANPHEKALASQATAVDGQGIERIVGTVDTTWKPAPLESTDAEKEAAERRNRMFSSAAKQRQEALSDTPAEA